MAVHTDNCKFDDITRESNYGIMIDIVITHTNEIGTFKGSNFLTAITYSTVSKMVVLISLYVGITTFIKPKSVKLNSNKYVHKYRHQRSGTFRKG